MPMPTKATLEQMTLFPRRDSLQQVIDEGLALLPITTPNQLLSLLYIQQNTMAAIHQRAPVRDWEPLNPWDNHPGHPRDDWEYEVSNGDTTLGYTDWVNHHLEAEE